MKKNRILMIAFAAMLTVGMSSCGKDDNVKVSDTQDSVPVNPNPGPNPDPVPDPAPAPDSTTVEWVDLGLPSGLLWNSCNLGATIPTQYGNYYAWGENTTKDGYSWSNYRYCNGDSKLLTKYCNNPEYGYNGFTDNLITLQAMDDAATQALGNGARTPTPEDWQELMDNTTRMWRTQYGVYGMSFWAANGNSIFLPAAGIRYSVGVSYAGSYGHYLTSSLHSSLPPCYECAYYFASDAQKLGYFHRCEGLSVRPVRSAQ